MQAETAVVPGVLDTVWAEGEGAVLDVPAAEGGADEGLDPAAGDGGAADGNADGGADEGLDPAAGDGEADAGAGGDAGEELSGAKLWHSVKEKLATLDPKERAAISRSIHKLAGIEKQFPEGIEKATATLAAVKQLAEDPAAAPEKVIADTLAERQYFRKLDQAYTEGKAEFAEKLATASPESFDKLAPLIFNKYAESNPDGFAGYVARTVLQHMDSADVPLHFKVLDTFLGQLPDSPAKERVIEACRGIFGWTKELRELGAKQPAKKDPAAKPGADGKGDDLQTREQQLAEREQQVTLQSWNNEALQPGIRSVYSEADKYSAGKKTKLDDTERKKVLSKVGEELDIRLAANKAYGETMRGYLKAGDKAKFLQRLESERKKLIPGAVRRAVDDVIAERPAKKGASVKAQGSGDGKKPAAAAGATTTDAGEKVEWIAGHPSTQGLVVDLNRTSHAMLLKKRAFVKGKTTSVAWK